MAYLIKFNMADKFSKARINISQWRNYQYLGQIYPKLLALFHISLRSLLESLASGKKWCYFQSIVLENVNQFYSEVIEIDAYDLHIVFPPLILGTIYNSWALSEAIFVHRSRIKCKHWLCLPLPHFTKCPKLMLPSEKIWKVYLHNQSLFSERIRLILMFISI